MFFAITAHPWPHLQIWYFLSGANTHNAIYTPSKSQQVHHSSHVPFEYSKFTLNRQNSPVSEVKEVAKWAAKDKELLWWNEF